MPDIPVNPAPAEPKPGDSALKKSTTRLIPLPLPLTESRPEGAPASRDKGDTAPISNIPTASRPAAPAGAPQPREGIQPGPPPNLKMQTMRIELDDVLSPPRTPVDRKNVTMPISDLMTSETPPPKPADRKNVTIPISDLMSTEQSTSKAKTGPMNVPTVAVARPAPAGYARQAGPSEGGSAQGRDGAKKKTSHLNLEPVPEDMPAKEAKHSTSPITVIPQTIRLKRTGGLTQGVPPPQKSQTDLISEAPTLGRMPDLSQVKMVTARILVEPDEQETVPPAEGKRRTSVIGTAPGAEPTPQTIHLKRPTASHLQETNVAGAASEAPTIVKTDKAQSSVPQEEGGPTSITQRKTIKIKRTERNVAPRTVKLRQPESIAGVAPVALGQAPAPADEEAQEALGPVFFALAAGAVVLVAGLVYFMAAQAFGPELVLPVPASLL